ncbi:hypothetical protein QHW22_07185 [Legionella pneumophila]|nr:hypothetical protein [Legionella pneumophila]AGH54875.1 hypothetical protein LPE509_02784 [Legionella pneumophila subsp. pneumophila LPE509]MDI0433589.1 hypothetical protein [Legionella pneumophila]
MVIKKLMNMFKALVYTLPEWHLLALSLWHNLFILFQDKGQTSLNKHHRKVRNAAVK